MTAISDPAQKPPLGVNGIVGESFSILFGNFINVMLLGFGGAFLGYLINGLMVGFEVAAGVDDGTGFVNAGPVPIIASSLVNLAVYGLVTGMLVQLAYDAKLGRSNSFGTYFNSALPALIPIAVLSVVVAILMAVGMLALIVGGLWVYAVFYVVIPACVIERAGFGAMSRSVELTKEYRWPIVGLFIVVMIMSAIIQMVVAFIGGAAIATLASGGFGAILLGVFLSLITGLGYAYGGIAVALVYARLREIKEGVDVDQIASVFD
ncbi:MAG: hypothetical protein AAF393_04705 [Pseudomonadota bacterium]